MSKTEREVPHMNESEQAYAHNVDHVMSHYKEGGYMHETAKNAKHAAGHTPFHEHVKKMARGGKC
jgi:hypothetical protein